MYETNERKGVSSDRASAAVEAMLWMQGEMSDVRETAGLETEEVVMRTVKELRDEQANV